MPQGNKKLASKRPKDVIVKADKEKLRKQTPKMKKGGKNGYFCVKNICNVLISCVLLSLPTIYD